MGGRLLPKRARRTLVPPVQFQLISGNPRPWWLHSSPRRRAPRALGMASPSAFVVRAFITLLGGAAAAWTVPFHPDFPTDARPSFHKYC
jgi:hypothetical protein